MFRHPPTAADSPLWPCLKIINLGAVGPSGKGHRRGVSRVFWLYWGADERRFRRSEHQRRFEQEQPTVSRATVAHLAEIPELRPEILVPSPELLEIERARLFRSRTVHAEHDRRRAAEAAAAEGSVGAADTENPLGPSNPRRRGSKAES